MSQGYPKEVHAIYLGSEVEEKETRSKAMSITRKECSIWGKGFKDNYYISEKPMRFHRYIDINSSSLPQSLCFNWLLMCILCEWFSLQTDIHHQIPSQPLPIITSDFTLALDAGYHETPQLQCTLGIDFHSMLGNKSVMAIYKRHLCGFCWWHLIIWLLNCFLPWTVAPLIKGLWH